ncbi:CBU_0592 family membrane protein [Coralloluteibacterium thermophilus]|uniref:CBU-0592-like domain-containing protein n=1 Tax=Coralloluteibacterium thermophilum TaxID=2707049 RepID=A0ABV9NKA9_9GAMM
MAEQLQWFDWLGLGGVAGILVAQLLLQIGAWRGDRLSFQAINLVGALCTLFSLVYTLNLTAFIALPLAWAVISGVGIYLNLGRRRVRPVPAPTAREPAPSSVEPTRRDEVKGEGGRPPF